MEPVAREAPGRGQTFAALLLLLVLFMLTAGSWLSLDQSPLASSGTLVLLWANVGLMLGGILLEARRRPYSLNLMHLVSMFLLMGTAALFQYTSGKFPVAGSIAVLRGQVTLAAAVITLWMLGYLIAYEVTHRVSRPAAGSVARFLSRRITPVRAFVMLAVALASLVYLGAIGLAETVTRGAARAALLEQAGVSSAAQTGGSLSLAYFLIHENLLRALSPMALLAAVLVVAADRRTRNPLFLGLLALVAVGTLVANNPFAAARMWFATVVIGVAAPLMLHRLKTGWGLVTITLLGITVLPTLHFSRETETLGELMQFFQIASPIGYLRDNADVDSLGMLSLVARWTEQFGHRWGMQILGGFLFWFPRTFWAGKPISTGTMVTEDLGFDFTNLAAPIPAEPLIDFGLVGVLPFAAIFGVVLARLDRAYWDGASSGPGIRILDAVFPLWLGCVLFLTRGGWFSALLFTVVFTIWAIPLGILAPRASRRVAALVEERIGTGRAPEGASHG